MKLIIISLVLLTTLICVNRAQPNQFLTSGVYVGVNSKFLNTFTQGITTEVQSGVNAFKIADIYGSDGKIKYQFTGIQQSVYLSDLYYSQYNSQSQYAVGFKNVTFTIHCDWQACYHIGDQEISLCEHGKVTINTQALVSLYTNITLDFNSASSATLKSTGTLMVVPKNGINYNVQCTSKVCDKTGEIRDKVSEQFVPQVQTSVTNGVNAKSSEFASYFPPLRKLNFTKNGYDFLLDSEGILVQSTYQPSSPNTPTLILDLQGGIVVNNSKGELKYPTQTPESKPSTTSIENFTTDISVLLTPYFIESLADAALYTSLPITITPSEVPSESPVTLNTSDPFFLQTAPGLAKYPNQAITVQLNHPVSPNVWINSSGITLNGTQIMAQFFIEDDKTSKNIFSINLIIEIEIKLSVALVGQTINITSNLVAMNPNAEVAGSEVGQVDPSGFVQLLQLLQGFIKLPSFAVESPVAQKYTISSPVLLYSNQYTQLTFNLNQKSSQQIKINYN